MDSISKLTRDYDGYESSIHCANAHCDQHKLAGAAMGVQDARQGYAYERSAGQVLREACVQGAQIDERVGVDCYGVPQVLHQQR